MLNDNLSNKFLSIFSKRPKVVVIGGGIAGLTVAYRLQQGGMDVSLYEARNRIGGRILTAKINGRIAELGAQSISDGSNASHLHSLISEFDLKCCSNPIYLKYSYFNRTDLIPISDLLKKKNFDPQQLKQTLIDLASTHSNMKAILEKIIDPEDPIYPFLSVRMAAYEGETVEKLSPLYIETLYHMLLGGISAAHQRDIDEEDFYVNLMTIEGGNSLLPEKIGEALGSNLHLNMPLRRVSKTENNKFELIFENGDQLQTDILILGMPCSVYEDILFENGIIPSDKLLAIKNVQYGRNAKIIVPIPSDAVSEGGLVVSDQSSVFFDRVKQLLTIFCAGTYSVFSPQTIKSAYSQIEPVLEQLFENYPSFMCPTYAKDESNLSYEGVVGYSWPNDPYVRGSYSYIASGQEKLLTTTLEQSGETFKELFAPISKSLYFVGEHTSILFDVGGTMEAACESGERIARAILNEKGID